MEQEALTATISLPQQTSKLSSVSSQCLVSVVSVSHLEFEGCHRDQVAASHWKQLDQSAEARVPMQGQLPPLPMPMQAGK